MSTVIWSDDETQTFYSLKRAGKSYKEIGSILQKSFGRRNYTPDSLEHKWRGANRDKFTVRINKKEKLVEELTSLETEKQKVVERTLDNNQRLVRREEARTHVIIDNIKTAIYQLPKPNMKDIVYKPSKTRKYTAEHVGLILSDMHIGASFTLDDTGGLSEYNLDIFKQRVERLKKSVFEIVERHQQMYDLPELHVFCLGDVVAGAFGCGQWNDRYISLDIYQQFMEGVQALQNLIASWATAFPKVNFYGIYGNHGRAGKRGQMKSFENWDHVCYAIAQIALKHFDNIEWHIPKAWWLNPKVQDHSFYLCHGDGIRGSMGIPFYGVERAESKIAGLLEQNLDYVLMGHFHSPAEIQTNSSRVLMNGSFMGGDMYSLQDLGRGSRPEQKIFGIHKKKGITWTYNVYLDGD
jgi:hypothetical protein